MFKFASWLRGTGLQIVRFVFLGVSPAAFCVRTFCLPRFRPGVFHFTQTAEKIQQTFDRFLRTGARRGWKSLSGLCCPKAGSAFTEPLLRKSVPFM